MRSMWRGTGSERGSTILLMSVMLFGMLALAALAIDLASLRSARSEAQRAADATALAGASAFRDFPWTDATTTDSASKRAVDIARLNQVRADTIDVRQSAAPVTTTYGWGKVRVVRMNQLTLNIIPDSQKVRAWVRHAGVQTFFGGLLGVPYGHVQAMATAWASDAGPTVSCLKPFVIPDIWYESDKVNQDANNNNYWDPNTAGPGNQQDGESWKFEPPSIGGSDYYLPYDPNVPNDPFHPQTGYGSSIRDPVGYPGDVGLPLLIKPQTGNGNGNSAPERMGNAFWLLDFDGNNGNVEDEITNGCAEASIGDPVPYLSGGHTGPTRKGVDNLIAMDPSATWNQATRTVQNSAYADWTKSPRVITIALISPEYWIASSKNSKPDPGSTFTNFARMFLLPTPKKGKPENIQAIFVGPAAGGTGGPNTGPLVRVLQLVE
jgi:hypothetical protein